MSDTDRDRLISAAYSATLSPNQFDDILDTFDALFFKLQTREQAKNPIQVTIDPDLILHFQLAHNIQKRLGRSSLEKSKVQLLLDAAPNPALVFNESEQIVARNKLASSAKSNQNNQLENYCPDPGVLPRIRKFMANGDRQKLLIAPEGKPSSPTTNTCVFIEKLTHVSATDQTPLPNPSARLFLFTLVNMGFDPTKTGLFQDTYQLTPAEMEVATHLAHGRQLVEIAKLRGVSLATIRSQLKSIKNKTHCRDIPSLVRLLCGFSAGLLVSSQLDQSVTAEVSTPIPHQSVKQLQLKDGRKMVFLDRGCPTGLPVIMIHNMPYGQELPEAAIEAAHRMKLRILSPYRPGYGDSDFAPNAHGDQLLDQVAADMCALLDQLNIKQAVIVGQTVGSVYALRFARLFPNRVLRLLAISRAPIWREEWLTNMPKRHRFIMRITKHVPQILPLVTRATIMLMDQGQSEQLTRSLLQDSAADTKALENPEILDLVVRSNAQGLKQGAEAFRRDCFLTIRDFSEEAKQLKMPFHILHGSDDKIVPAEQSKAFTKEIPGTTLEIVQGAGTLLMFSHWERVFKAIQKTRKTDK